MVGLVVKMQHDMQANGGDDAQSTFLLYGYNMTHLKKKEFNIKL